LLQALYQEFQESTGYCIDSVHVTFFAFAPLASKTPLTLHRLEAAQG